VSVDGKSWALLNCSPDILEQIGKTKALHPARGKRHSPITSVILTNGDIDHIGGLLSLREKQPLKIWAAAKVLKQLSENPIFAVLDRQLVSLHEVTPDTPFSPLHGLAIELFTVPGKVPLYREENDMPSISRDGNTFGLHMRAGEAKLSYLPGCGEIDEKLLHDLAKTQILFFDGTLFTDDEMIKNRTGEKTGRRMGHVSVSGADGTIEKLQSLPAKQRIFIHMNNTNPMLIDGSAQHKAVAAQGWQVGADGMEFSA